ncbi:unnamed protein product [Amoebophrya sp. A25]|nr:unnamed protein product [Amoebophrya sp. A25]|eukprot:GSA25T00016483001.1
MLSRQRITCVFASTACLAGVTAAVGDGFLSTGSARSGSTAGARSVNAAEGEAVNQETQGTVTSSSSEGAAVAMASTLSSGEVTTGVVVSTHSGAEPTAEGPTQQVPTGTSAAATGTSAAATGTSGAATGTTAAATGTTAAATGTTAAATGTTAAATGTSAATQTAPGVPAVATRPSSEPEAEPVVQIDVIQQAKEFRKFIIKYGLRKMIPLGLWDDEGREEERKRQEMLDRLFPMPSSSSSVNSAAPAFSAAAIVFGPTASARTNAAAAASGAVLRFNAGAVATASIFENTGTTSTPELQGEKQGENTTEREVETAVNSPKTVPETSEGASARNEEAEEAARIPKLQKIARSLVTQQQQVERDAQTYATRQRVAMYRMMDRAPSGYHDRPSVNNCQSHALRRQHLQQYEQARVREEQAAWGAEYDSKVAEEEHAREKRTTQKMREEFEKIRAFGFSS